MNFRGEFPCTMDDKGRIKMPSSLRKLFPAEDKGAFMIAKDIEECLVIYPMKAWEEKEASLRALNQSDPDLRQFVRASMIGLTEAQFDNADRFLVNKGLAKHLGNSKDVVLLGVFDQIQIWDAARLEQYQNASIGNIKGLAAKAAQEQKEKK